MAGRKQCGDGVVKDMIRTGSWAALEGCLQQQQLSESQLPWALRMASERASEAELVCLVPHIPSAHLYSVLTEVLKRELWGCVPTLLARGLTPQERKWALSGASKRAVGDDLQNIICHECVERDLLDCALPNLVNRGQWAAIRRLVPHHVTDAQQRWIMRSASQHADQVDVRWLLPHCDDDQLDSVLMELVKRGLWSAVGDVLKRPVSDMVRRRAVEAAVTQSGDVSEFGCIVRYCTDDQVESVLTAAVDRQMWGVVETALRRGVNDEILQWAVLEAMKHASEQYVRRLIDEYSEDLDLGPVLSQAVRRRLWLCVGDLLKHRLPDARKTWAVEEASRHAPEEQLLPLLLHCNNDQLEAVLKETVRRRLWDCALDLLRRRMDDTLNGWAVLEASRHAVEHKLRPLLRYCTPDVFQGVLTETVRRGLWRAANHLLQSQHDAGCVPAALAQALDQLTEDVDLSVKNAIQNHAWTVASCLLEHWPLSDVTRRLAVDRACKSGVYHSHCGYQEFASIVRHCDVTQLVLALEAAVKRNTTHAVRDILTRIGRHGDPLTVTRNGQTVLAVVMETKQCRRELVAKCIKLGMSTHQADVTDFYLSACQEDTKRPAILSLPGSVSPFVRAIITSDYETLRMLYESGGCSYRELRWLHQHFSLWCLQSPTFLLIFGHMSDYIETKATNPRSLMSACRLVISHHLGVGESRHEKAKQLPLPEPLRDYVTFSDLVNLDVDQAASFDDVMQTCDAVDNSNVIREIAFELHDFQNANH